MLQALKLRRLAGQLRGKKPAEAYSAVLELGRMEDARAVDLLIETLLRRDGLARCAARELGRIKAEKAIAPLVELLSDPEISQSAAEALVKIGGPALEALLAALRSSDLRSRRLAAEVLGQLGEGRAVAPLGELAQTDDDYDVRVAAVDALGLLKDPRGIWVMVNILKLRDEADPERRAGLERLRQAANRAMRRIGDPLANRQNSVSGGENVEESGSSSGLHPRLAGDLGRLTLDELVELLRELIQASEEIGWAKLEHREPHLLPYFAAYSQRERTAELVGEELVRRGGKELRSELLVSQLNNHAALRNWWAQ